MAYHWIKLEVLPSEHLGCDLCKATITGNSAYIGATDHFGAKVCCFECAEKAGYVPEPAQEEEE